MRCVQTNLWWLVAVWLATAAAANGQPAAKKDDDGRPAVSIVATVGDQAILLDEVIAPIQAQLRQARAQLPLEKYREVERELLSQVVRTRIQRIILIKELENFLPNKDVIKRIRTAANKDFESYLLRLAHESGMKSRDEIVKRIKDEGSDLEALRRDFVDNMLAQQYLEKLIQPATTEPTREQLYEYYQSHKDEFAEAAGAVWRQIQISYSGDQNAARAKAQECFDKLVDGQPFAELARKYSDGPTAIDGGLWSLTSKNSYADPAVDNALFALPIGQHSQIIPGQTAFHIILVEKRSDGAPQPFSEVQTVIKNKLMREGRSALSKKKMEELTAKYHIETIFDDDKATKTASSDDNPPR